MPLNTPTWISGLPRALTFSVLVVVLFATPALPQSEAASVQTLSPAGDVDPQLLSLVRQKRWKEVVKAAEAIRSQSPDNSQAAYWLGVANLQLHEPMQAVLAFRSAEELGINSSVFHEGLGLAYYDLNQYVLFEQQMQKASQMDAADSKPYYYLGLYQLTIRSDVARALPLFQSAVQFNQNDWKSLYQEGFCLEQLGKLEQAHAKYLSAIGLVEKSGVHFGWPYQGMARLLMDDNPQAALSFASKAVALEPNEPSNHLVLADVYQRLNRLPDAIREGEIAVAQNPSDASTHYTLYKLYRESGNPKAPEELKVFDQVTKLYGSN